MPMPAWLLQLDHTQDVLVLHLPQRLLGDAPVLERLPRILHLRRAEETAHVVCSELGCHLFSSFNFAIASPVVPAEAGTSQP